MCCSPGQTFVLRRKASKCVICRWGAPIENSTRRRHRFLAANQSPQGFAGRFIHRRFAASRGGGLFQHCRVASPGGCHCLVCRFGVLRPAWHQSLCHRVCDIIVCGGTGSRYGQSGRWRFSPEAVTGDGAGTHQCSVFPVGRAIQTGWRHLFYCQASAAWFCFRSGADDYSQATGQRGRGASCG